MFIADFHIHSKYSRATSRDMDLEHLEQWARIKGIKLMGTGDFTHPAWFKEIASKLEPAEPGLFKLKDQYAKLSKKSELNWFMPLQKPEDVRYILTTELSCIYSKNNKTRKVHLMVFAPSLAFVEKFNANLGWLGNLKSDGRPILGLSAKEIAKIVFNLSAEAAVIPAHIWTPWFSMFGSMSGFDSIQQCFEEYARNIFAVETGLSSDPAMNWRVSKIDGITLISNSDSHSPRRIGREANMFEGRELSYKRIMEALRLGARAPLVNLLRMTGTIEFFPEEGKYHYDGHRACKIVYDPIKTKQYKNKCPICRKNLTIGVMNRVEEMADSARPAGFKPEKGVLPYLSMIPLEEIIADAFDCGVGTKTVEKEYQALVNRFGNEFNVLMNASGDDLKNAANSQVAEGILRVRQGKVKIEPGYDGEYGKVKIFENGEQKEFSKQSCLF